MTREQNAARHLEAGKSGREREGREIEEAQSRYVRGRKKKYELVIYRVAISKKRGGKKGNLVRPAGT